MRGWTVVNLGLMPYDILVLVGITDKEVARVLKKYGLGDEYEYLLQSGTVKGRYVWAEKAHAPVIRIFKPLTAESQWTLAHEAFHAISAILRKSGTPLSEDTDEIYAYALGHVIEQVNQGLRAH